MTLLIREQKEESERAPFYMVEVFTKKDFNSEWCKNHIWETTVFLPAVSMDCLPTQDESEQYKNYFEQKLKSLHDQPY